MSLAEPHATSLTESAAARSPVAPLVYGKDWSQTSLGPIDRWPQSLRTLVDMLLAHPLPMILLWGPELIQIYNDGYARLVGSKHPAALGIPTRDCWAEVAHITDPIYDRVLQHGESVTLEDHRLPLACNDGASNPVFVSACYSPARDDTGHVAGIFITLIDTTDKIHADQQRDRAAAAIRDREEQYRSFVRLSSEGIWRFDVDEPIAISLPEDEQIRLMFRHAYLAECNDAMARMYGFASAEGLTGRRLADFHSETDPRSIEFLRAFIQNGYRLDDAESAETDRDGNPRIFLNSFVGVVDEGKLIRAWGTQRDVTEQRRAEIALRESEQRVRILADALPALISYVGPDHRYQFNNRAYLEWFGQDAGKIAGKHMRDVLGETIYAQRLPHVQAALAGQTVRFVGPTRHQHKGMIESEIVYVPDVAADGTVKGFVVLVQDITERRAAEDAIRASEDRLRLGLKAGNTGTWDWDIRRNKVVWSERLYEFHGLAPGEYDGTVEGFSALIHPDDRDRVGAAIQGAMQSGQPYELEFRTVRPTGEIRWLFTAGQVVYGDQRQPIRMLGATIDITERKRAGEARRMSEFRFQRLIEQSPLSIQIFNPDGTIRQVNRAWVNLWGVTPADLPGYNIRHDPQLTERGVIHLIERAFNGEPATIEPLPYILDRGEHQGETHWCGAYIYPVKDDAGRVMEVVLVHNDVTEQYRADAAAREAEKQMRLLTDALPTLIAYVDKDLRYRFNNRAYLDWFGIPPEKIAGVHLSELFDPGGYQERLPHVHAVLAGETTRFESVVEHRKRGRIEAEILYFPDHAEDGSVRGFVVLAQDISDRRRAERQLRDSEARYRLVNRVTNDVIWDWDFTTDEVHWNESLQQVYGHRPADIPKASTWWYSMIHPDDRQRVVDGIHAIIDSQDQYAWQQEYRFQRGDGTYAEVLDRGYVQRDPHGRAIRMIGSMLDLTERKKAEAALRAATERWELAVTATQDGIWDWNIAANSVYWSPRSKEMLGYADHELPITFEVIRDLIHPDDRDRAWAETERHLRGESPLFQSEYRLRARDGTHRWVLSRGKAIRDASGNVTRMLGSQTDITEQKAAEEQLRRAKEEAERASRAKDDFIAILSHELRTPLTPVLLTLSLMESSSQLPDELRSDVATIRRNVELESRLISDLLDLTRITRGKLQLDMQNVDLHLILRSAIDICQREASSRLIVELTAHRHTVRGDSTRLQQIFWNLINNAIKFTGPEGQITVRSSELQDARGGRIRVEIIDTGVGIDAAILPKLFTAFEQGEVRAVRQQAGLGLGLTISKRLAQAHHGTITAHSAGRGQGATFTVELPLADVYPPQPARPTSPAPAPTVPLEPLTPHAPPAPQHLKILLVEDHETTLLVLTRLLRKLGHTVTGATSLATALAAARHNPFDIIISDLGLPDGSGLDLMRELRDTYTGKAIALTGYGMESDITASHEAGFAEHLTKPIDLEKLQAALLRIHGQRVKG
ncbi:MAG TPA: PAS domain S-box protein [Tepidisphaeraceae bacterium]